jgi:hypothetical protein
MKPNRSTIIDRNRKAIAGVKLHYGNATKIVLDGVARKPSDIVTIFQDQIDAIDEVAAAKVTFHQKVVAQKAATSTANAVFLALKTRVFSDFKTSAEIVGEFGIALPKRRAPKPKTLVEAAAKREATREARHTMGERQRAEVKGDEPKTPPSPVGHA